MKRRKFIGSLAGSLAVGMSFAAAGCSFESIFATISAFVPVGLSALAGIIALIPGLSVASPILLAVKAAFADLSAIVTEYQNAPSADKATLLGKITTALSAVIDNFQTFVSSLSIPSGVATLVEGFASLILSTLEGFANALTPTATAPAIQARLSTRTIQVSPARRSVKDFKKQWNALASANGHPEVELQ